MPQPLNSPAAGGQPYATVAEYLETFLGQPMPLGNGNVAPSFYDYLRGVRQLDPALFSQTAMEVIALSIELSMYTQMLAARSRGGAPEEQPEGEPS